MRLQWRHLVAFILLVCAAPTRVVAGAVDALNILAFDTSSQWCSVVLQAGERAYCRETLAGQRHSQLVLPMIHDVLSEAGMRLLQLDAIAFGAGPGSFTGVRIACGVAQGLAFGAQVAVAPVSTLLALAERSGKQKVIACLDARMGQVYIAAYERVGAGWRTLAEPQLCTPEAAPAVEGGNWIGVGSGFGELRAALTLRYGTQLADTEPDLYAHAREIGQLGAAMVHAGTVVAAECAQPVYLRDRIALTIEERRALKAQRDSAATPAA